MPVPNKWTVDSVLGCWLWQGATTPAGYAVANVDGRTQLVRRALWRERKGELDGLIVLRSTCHRRACVNPAHLTPVSAAQAVRMRRRRSAPRRATRNAATGR